MKQVQVDQPRQEVHALMPAAGQSLTRSPRSLGLGAVALGAFALGATAIGALAIGRLAIGSFVVRRGRLRSLTAETLEVRRLHIGELIVDSRLSP